MKDGSHLWVSAHNSTEAENIAKEKLGPSNNSDLLTVVQGMMDTCKKHSRNLLTSLIYIICKDNL